MLGRLDPQQTFWDATLYARLLPQDHRLLEIDRVVDFGFVEQETADLYSPDQGRPSYPPEQLFRLLVVAYLEGLSDVEVVSQVRYNLVYRYFCRFGLMDPTPDDTTLVVFRRRLGPERFERLFAQVVKQAQQHGLLAGTYKLVDATVVRADAALRNRAELLREGRRRLVKTLARQDPEQAARLAGLAEPAPRDDRSYRQVLAEEEARTAKLLAALADVSDPAVACGREELRKVYTGEGGVASFTDPDARWGFKKKDEPFLGYKAHVSCDASGIVTAVQTLPGNAAEGEHLTDLLAADAQQAITARCVVADKAYDSAANREAIRAHGLRPAIPERHRHKTAGRFRYRPRKDVLRCPAGKQSIGKSPHARGGYLYYFSQADCRRCPLRDGCLSPGQTRKVVYLSERARQLRRHPPKDLASALAQRKGIERKFGEAKRWHGLDRARYRGIGRVAIQVLMTFLVLNLKRMARLLMPRGAPRLQGLRVT